MTKIQNSKPDFFTEYQVWAAEFGDDIKFELGDQICEGFKCCMLIFKVSK